MKGIQTINIQSKWLDDESKRLDASYYAKDVISAKLLLDKLKEKGLRIDSLENFAIKIFWPGRFKRIYVSKKEGHPFLMPSEAFMFIPKASKYIANYPKNLFVNNNSIIVTRSGTIGRCLIVTDYLQRNFILSDDLIRVIPKDDDIFYLYTYLNTWIGQSLLTKNKYGATVKHIEPNHVANIPVPRIPDLEKYLIKNIIEAQQLREEAQELFLKALEMIYSETCLPKIELEDYECHENCKKNIAHLKFFSIKSNEIDYRLDASYHLPLAKMAIRNIENSNMGDVCRLNELAYSFVPPRFKRPYVDNPANGIPLLQGSHISQIKVYDLKYIWNKMKNLSNYIIKKNWILVTCSGTIGKTALVSEYHDNWAATNHILRIIPYENKINPGYLVGFLSTDYGQIQLQRLIYGGVVDEIGESGELFNNILVLKPSSSETEEKIGKLVTEAFKKRDHANMIEKESVNLLSRELTSIAEGVKLSQL